MRNAPRTSSAAASGSPMQRGILVGAVFAFCNLGVLFAEVLWVLDYYNAHAGTDYVVDQDIWMPLMRAVGAQAVINGLILVLWPRTRRVGVGVLLGTAGAAIAVLVLLVATASS